MPVALVYDSHPLEHSDRFQHWYQWLILGGSIFALTLPTLHYLYLFASYRWRLYRARPTNIKVNTSGRAAKALRDVYNSCYFEDSSFERLSDVKSYALCTSTSPALISGVQWTDLLALPYDADVGIYAEATTFSLLLAYYETKDIYDSEEEGLVGLMNRIHETFSRDTPFKGVVLALSDTFSSRNWMTLYIHLKHLNLLVFLELNPPYSDLVGINLTLVDGLIIRNATTLTTGLRRDFFRAFELRDVLGRCSKQRTARPSFTTILHDPCETPSPPTLRRAYKFARFHEVILSVCQSDLNRVPQCLPLEEPYSAFDWLKRLDALDLHKAWNDANVVDLADACQIELPLLEKDLPGVSAAFFASPVLRDASRDPGVELGLSSWSDSVPSRTSYFTVGDNGELLCHNACYDLGEQILDLHAASILETQKHLRELELLHDLTIYEIQEVLDRLAPFLLSETAQADLTAIECLSIQSLIDKLKNSSVRVFRGLDSGFMLPENRLHLWAVHEEIGDTQYVYISLKSKDMVATLLHTFLLIGGMTRRRCFEIELSFAKSTQPGNSLPVRIVHQLQDSTYSELLSHIYHIRLSRDGDCDLLQRVADFSRFLLLEETTRTAWKKIHGEQFLSEAITIEELYQTRLDWFTEIGISNIPSVVTLVRLHRKLERRILRALRDRDLPFIDLLTSTLGRSYTNSTRGVSVETDLFGLMVLCIFRKYGVEETYIESSDRCPVYHFQTDQPGVFSELWVIGSQCEVYFDVTPGVLGAMHYTRYREYLNANPPPADAWNGIDVFTAYHKVESPTPEGTVPGDDQVMNPFEAKNAVFFPRLQKFAFLTVFCLPAVCDVMLLVFLGRGVFQSGYMSAEEVVYGTYALLTALLLCSGTIAWIGSSGGYYLYNAAFDSLNHLMAQRLSGCIVLSLTVGILGFVGLGSQRGWYAGLVFILYLMALNTYLNILGILATMHRDGSPLPSGRTVLMKSLPILLISPVLSTFVHGHDFLIYIVVIYIFLFVLYFNYRQLVTEWSQFHTKIKTIDDKQVLAWYRSSFALDDDFEDFELARQSLEQAVQRARRPNTGFPLSKRAPVADLITQLAPGLEYSRWLLKKDIGPGASVPAPYSSAWNNSLKVSLNTYQLFLRGLKEHSAFLQFRYAKNDIGYNSAMFIAALLDRWVSIIMSAAGDGPLNIYRKPGARYGIAFALSYFLMSAVALDYQLQFCWTAVVATSTKRMTDTQALDSVEVNEMARKKSLYWRSLKDLAVIMLFIFGIWTMMLVFWVNDPQELQTYFAYAGAYTCVLWSQFNRVFIKNSTQGFLLLSVSIAIGFFTGVVLHLIPATQNFYFADIIALATCNVIAVLTSFIAADFGSGRDEAEDDVHSPQGLMNKTGWKTHSQKYVGLDLNQTERLPDLLSQLSVYKFSKLIEISKTTHPELAGCMSSLFKDAYPERSIRRAIPQWRSILSETRHRWAQGQTKVFVIPSSTLDDINVTNLSAFGCVNEDDILELYIPLPVVTESWLFVHREPLAKLMCEAMIHETCECILQMTHSDAVCAELLLCFDYSSLIPDRIKKQIQGCSIQSEVEIMVQRTHAEILTHLCLGVKADVQWTSLPADLRILILARISDTKHAPSADSVACIESLFKSSRGLNWEQYIERSNVRIRLACTIDQVCRATIQSDVLPRSRNSDAVHAFDQHTTYINALTRSNDFTRRIFYGLYTFFQYIAVISNADADVPRELVYSTRASSFRSPARSVLLFLWRISLAFRRNVLEITLLHSRPELTEILYYCRKGEARTLYKDKLIVKAPFQPKTGFRCVGAENEPILEVYSGTVEKMPDDKNKMSSRATYDQLQRLLKLETMAKGETKATCTYEYQGESRLPLSRKCDNDIFHYDQQGRVSNGCFAVGSDVCSFEYTFSAARDTKEILSATYTLKQEVVCVFWCVPRQANADETDVELWTPTLKVSKTIHQKDGIVWETQYTYHHKRDPSIRCIEVRSSNEVRYLDKPPEWVLKDPNKFFVKPDVLHIDTDDLLYHHPPAQKWYQKVFYALPLAASRSHFTPINTGALRSMLWERWHKSKSLDGVTACYVDTQILRNARILKPYWRARETGQFHTAIEYLDKHLELINAQIEIEDHVSQNTFLPYKLTDLYTMGTSGSANVKTRTYDDNYSDTKDRLSVIFLDTGCFPDQPGGVSNCRRDLVNGHTTIRNHVFTESANDFGVPRYQVDRNIQSVKVLPMWGLDYLSPYHGLFENLLDSQVRYREHHTSEKDIEELFLPILRKLIRGARSQIYTQRELSEYTQAFVDLSIYFEEKDYLKTWRSNLVKRTWREGWLQDMPNTIPTSTYFTLELPSMAQLDEAMELWTRYFFVFSVRIPDEVPTVFQCTHHGVGSIYGMLLKLRRGTTYMIWDHAIYWRESCLNISSSQCILNLSVQNMLLGVIKLASHLCYTHADVILPCTNLFNPGWEADIGSDQGRRQHKIGFMRKIDPVVNGISEMERFEPVDKIRSENPTVMMLSNVQFIKDVKNAVFSADIIVNRFKFKKYRLVIYGAMDRTPQYTSETEAIIKTRRLENNVKLAGFGNPKEILKDAWAFMNSSLSEGLPLAIGEAALSGCPVIATDVGATGLVISDPKDPKIRYGEIVPPNDSVALARAQIQILAMLGPWVKYCGDNPPPMPEVFTEDDVNWITQRMYDKTEERRALGRKGRETVLHSFNGNRYLREHEQMYWLGSYRARQRADLKLQEASKKLIKYGEVLPIVPIILPRRSKLWDENPWRYFDDKDGSIGRLKNRIRQALRWVRKNADQRDRNVSDDHEVRLQRRMSTYSAFEGVGPVTRSASISSISHLFGKYRVDDFDDDEYDLESWRGSTSSLSKIDFGEKQNDDNDGYKEPDRKADA